MQQLKSFTFKHCNYWYLTVSTQLEILVLTTNQLFFNLKLHTTWLSFAVN